MLPYRLRWLIITGCLIMTFLSIQLVSAQGSNANAVIESEFKERFFTSDMTYVMWQYTEDDDYALQAHYGFSLRLFDCEKGMSNKEDDYVCGTIDKPADSKFYVDFSYTGEFDFYMGTRESGPVVNRKSNPALHFIWEYKESMFGFDYLDIGVEHRSNGQVVDANETVDDLGATYLTQQAYDNGDYQFFDTISRGADFVSFEAGTTKSKDEFWSISYKVYVTHDSNITWGELAFNDVDIMDYDLLRLKYKTNLTLFNQDMSLLTEYTLGKELLKTDSIDFSLFIPFVSKSGNWRIPFFVKAHFGPMERLSDYTKSTQSIGAGLVFHFE